MIDLPLTLFDLGVVIVLVLSTVVALSRGLIREVVGLASWAGAAVVAWYAFPAVRLLARDAIGTELIADLLAGAGVFLVPLVVFKIVGGILASGVESIGLGGLDRLLGIAFGVARGALLVCVAWLVYGALAGTDRPPAWVQTAYLFEPVDRGADWLRRMLPEQLAAEGRAAAERAGDSARKLETVREVLGAPKAAPKPGEPGYSDDQRRAMDKLFKPDG